MIKIQCNDYEQGTRNLHIIYLNETTGKDWLSGPAFEAMTQVSDRETFFSFPLLKRIIIIIVKSLYTSVPLKSDTTSFPGQCFLCQFFYENYFPVKGPGNKVDSDGMSETESVKSEE